MKLICGLAEMSTKNSKSVKTSMVSSFRTSLHLQSSNRHLPQDIDNLFYYVSQLLIVNHSFWTPSLMECHCYLLHTTESLTLQKFP